MEKKKYGVETEYIGIVHILATCFHCDYEEAIAVTSAGARQRLRYGVKNHVAKTGHTVAIEKATAIRYFAK